MNTARKYRVAVVVAGILLAAQRGLEAAEERPAAPPVATADLALVATSSTSFVSGHETIKALNDGFTPAHSDDKSRGAYGNWPRSGRQWVQYDWDQPVTTAKIDVYWFDDQRGVRLPQACRLEYWNGENFVDVGDASGWGLAANQFNTTTYSPVTTTKLVWSWTRKALFRRSPRMESLGHGRVTELCPAGPGRAWIEWFCLPARRTSMARPSTTASRTRPPHALEPAVGPGSVEFADARGVHGGTISAVGHYVLKLTAEDGQATASDTLAVQVASRRPTSR